MLLAFLMSGLSQYQIDLIPRVSPDKGVLSKVGYTDIIIEYSSPAVKERDIWGGLIPYDKVWRAGANNATTIEYSEDVKINGKALAAGKYAVFMIPRSTGDWDLIFNTRDDQWGAFSYDSSDDVLVVKVQPQTISFTENLEYSIENIDFNEAVVSMVWETKSIRFTVNTEYIKILEKEVDLKVKDANADVKWVVYLQGAEYLLEQSAAPQVALIWINESEKLAGGEFTWDEQYYPQEYVMGHLYWTKAKVLAANSKFAEAKIYADKCKSITGDYTFYGVDGDVERIDELSKEWKSR